MNPYASLLLVLPAHVWLVALTREERRAAARRWLSILALSLAPLVAAIALALRRPRRLAVRAALDVVSCSSARAASRSADCCSRRLAAGCAVAAAAALLAPAPPPPPEIQVTVRGPLSYAGPGSLGGTASALRR